MHAPNAMAATSHPLGSQAAMTVLARGGNAMDAAIAACAVQCVAEPGSTGIGGDCFCMFAPEGSAADIVAYNGSGRAPAALTPATLAANAIERRSPHAVTVPGAVEAWARLQADHGRLDLAEALAPAIGYAERGVPVSPRVNADFAGQAAFLRGTDARALLHGGQAPGVGATMRQPRLARSLRAIAADGPDAFYRGWIADDILERLQGMGGAHTREDLAGAGGEYVTPVTAQFRGRTVCECPPNGQGVIALLLLNMMERPDICPGGPLTAARIHREIEACRLAYRARNLFVADPAFGDVPLEGLLSKEYARDLAARIDPGKATEPAAGIALALPPHRATVAISVVDRDRNACALLNSLFHPFGSGIVAPESGVLLHNRGEGFSLEAGHPNRLAPGKRPLHTIIPAMVAEDGRVTLSFGVMGGHYQAFGHMQFLTRHYDFGLDLQEAVDLPRFMADPETGVVAMENGIGEETRAALARLGHRIETPALPIGGAQAIAIDWDANALTGASDPRKDGCAIGL